MHRLAELRQTLSVERDIKPRLGPEHAQERWRAVNAPHLVALVRAGARFERGVPAERADTVAA